MKEVELQFLAQPHILFLELENFLEATLNKDCHRAVPVFFLTELHCQPYCPLMYVKRGASQLWSIFATKKINKIYGAW